MTLEEAERLLATASGQDQALFTVLIFTGLRPNEALALGWDDIDFDREMIRVRRSINRFEGVGLPKTASSERDVDMLPTCELLSTRSAHGLSCEANLSFRARREDRSI